MSSLTIKQIVTTLVIAAFVMQLLFIPGSADAKWRDNSDQLPNDGSSTATTVLLIAAAGCLVVATVLMIKHHNNSKSKQSGTDTEKAPASDSTATSTESSSIGGNSRGADYPGLGQANSVASGNDRFISPYVGVTPAAQSLSGEKSVVAGVVIGF